MASRNGASTYACRHCRSELGAIRRTGAGDRVFAVAAGILARYREGGTLELTCSCGRISPVEEMQASALPIGSRRGGRSLWWG